MNTDNDNDNNNAANTSGQAEATSPGDFTLAQTTILNAARELARVGNIDRALFVLKAAYPDLTGSAMTPVEETELRAVLTIVKLSHLNLEDDVGSQPVLEGDSCQNSTPH